MHEPLFHSAVYVLLVNPEGEYLLQRRKNTGYMDGYWDASATGHVETGESVFDTAIRETAEEIGVQVARENLEIAAGWQLNRHDRQYLNYIFVCKQWEGEPSIAEPEKCDGLEWFAPEELPEKITPGLYVYRESRKHNGFYLGYVDDSKHDEIEGVNS